MKSKEIKTLLPLQIVYTIGFIGRVSRKESLILGAASKLDKLEEISCELLDVIARTNLALICCC